jgi:hypothetical protein
MQHNLAVFAALFTVITLITTYHSVNSKKRWNNVQYTYIVLFCWAMNTGIWCMYWHYRCGLGTVWKILMG